MSFDPSRIDEDACGGGHLDTDPVHDVLLSIGGGRTTGRLTIEDEHGANHMYFMQGRPVGVQLSEFFHPLGQLLLELGRIDGATFVAAQRLISEGARLPGQVFKELGVLDDDSLKEVLAIQARLKAEHFCRLGQRPFTFCRGLTFLSGFNSTPLDIHAVIFLAVRQQMSKDARAQWLAAAKDKEVRLRPTTRSGDKQGAEALLPAPLAVFGFGPPEERFLQRILAGHEKVVDLQETGTLPRDEMAVLLRYLELVERLEIRPIGAKPQPPPHFPDDDVFSSSAPRKRADLRGSPAAPAPITALTPRPSFDEKTEPRAQRPIDEEHTAPIPQPVRKQTPPPVEKMPQFRSVLINDQPPPEPDPEAAPQPKKKKVKRTTPLPSMGTGPMVTETRKEKTMITPMPSIVIADDDDE